MASEDGKTRQTRFGAMGQRSVWDVPIGWLLIGGVMAIVLAFAGWMSVLRPQETGLARIGEAVYRALAVNTMSDIYSRPMNDADLDPSAPAYGFFLLTLARWIGALVFFLTLAKVVVRLFWQNVLTWWASRFYSDHVVIAGDRPFARHAAEEAVRKGLKVVHFMPGGQELVRDGVLTLDSDIGLEGMLRLSGAHRARSLVFAFSDNAENADLARRCFVMDAFSEAAETHKRRETGQIGPRERVGPHIFVMLDDDWFEHREELNYAFHKAPEGEGTTSGGKLDSIVEIISESRAAARAVLGRHPLFTLQEGGIQHTLLLGFGTMGEALLTEICESQRIDPDRPQKITILDPDPESWARFERRCPGWQEVFDGAFFPARLDAPGVHEAGLLQRLNSAPLTAAYVVTGARLDPVIGAAQLKQWLDQQSEEGRLDAEDMAFPVFACVRGGSAQSGPLAAQQVQIAGDGPVMARLPIIAFGAWPEVVAAARVLDEEPDAAAFLVHSVHNQLFSPDPPTNWSQVEEVNRYSSRSAANFIPALIHAAGYDLGDWLKASAPLPPSINRLPKIAAGRQLAEGDSEEIYLARLEHARWRAERFLRGFRWAEQTDKPRRRHADLVEFAQLPAAAQDYNINYVRTLSDSLLPAARGALAPDRPAAHRILLRPSDMALAARSRTRAEALENA